AGREDIRVFTFDAWAHQGDCLRRSFIEEFVHFLRQTIGPDKPSWIAGDAADRAERIIHKLQRRQEDSSIESHPSITGWGVLFLLSVCLAPFGIGLLATPKASSAGWCFGLGMAMAASPAAVIALFGAVWLTAHAWRRRKAPSAPGDTPGAEPAPRWRWLRETFPVNREDSTGVLGSFMGETTRRTTTTTRRHVDPTSIEFRGYYLELLGAALGQDERRRLVIVLDNLDRVEPDTALAAWATMRTFLRPGARTARDDIRSRVWLIVPYDPDAISRLWEREPSSELARAFKEKTFQIRYRVAPPLASRWEDFFGECLRDALGEDSQHVHDAVYHIFRIQALPSLKRSAPTPRDMKLFTNRMVALAQQHYPDVPLPEIALYVAMQLSEPRSLENIAEANFKNEKYFASFLGDQWKHGLAAIHFGVERAAAAEVLYEPVIRQYLADGSSQSLKTLLDNPGAKQCCERYVRTVAPDMSVAEVLAASAAFGGYSPSDAGWNIGQCMRLLAKRIGNSGPKDWRIGGVLTPGNNVDLFAAQLIDNLAYATSPGTDTRSHRIHIHVV
ncbi:hypothetical protein LCGC14_2281220, partial [marine sediment metagenome]